MKSQLKNYQLRAAVLFVPFVLLGNVSGLARSEVRFCRIQDTEVCYFVPLLRSVDNCDLNAPENLIQNQMLTTHPELRPGVSILASFRLIQWPRSIVSGLTSLGASLSTRLVRLLFSFVTSFAISLHIRCDCNILPRRVRERLLI